MNQKDRLKTILDLLEERKELSTEELIEELAVSKDTIRRDILVLLNQELVERYRGGISLPVMKEKIQTYTDRMIANAKAKNAIALKAIEEIKPHQVLFFDVSTTVQMIAEHLNHEQLMIVTQSVDNAFVLSKKNKTNDVFLLGGLFDAQSHLIYGEATIEQLSTFLFDCAFIGAAGISTNGVFYSELTDIQMKKAIIKNAKKVCLVVDSSKMAVETSFKLAFSGIDLIISNRPFSKELKNKLEDHNIQIIITEE